MFSELWRYCFASAFKISLVWFIVIVAVGEFGCFWWAFFTWHVPANSSDALNLLLVSDSQIPGYKEERQGIRGYITRFDSDWYLKKAFFLALLSFSPDAVIHLGDILDEGAIATNDQFEEYKVRHDKIFITPDGISQIHVAGDNDIGGEWIDSMTENNVLRFSRGFGSINDVIKLKSFQIVKFNTVALLRRRPFKDERKVYNKTLAFIEHLPSKIDKNKISILIGHVPLAYISEKQEVPLTNLINAIQPSYAFSGHLHNPVIFEHDFGTVKFTEYVVPTCSYRMGTDKIGAAIAVLGTDGSIDYSVLRLPRRYPFLYAYLVSLCICIVLGLPWLMSLIMFIVGLLRDRLKGRKCCPVIAKLKEF
ncbi:metallophosphoesterase 1 homolog [Oculina patagonica]